MYRLENKQIAIRLALLLLILGLLCASATAQSSNRSIPVNASPNAEVEITPEQAIDLLTDEALAARTLIDDQKSRINALESELEIERKRGDSLQASLTQAEREIDQLKRAVATLEKATVIYEQTVKQLQARTDELARDNKSLRKRNRIMTVLAIAGLIIKFAL